MHLPDLHTDELIADHFTSEQLDKCSLEDRTRYNKLTEEIWAFKVRKDGQYRWTEEAFRKKDLVNYTHLGLIKHEGQGPYTLQDFHKFTAQKIEREILAQKIKREQGWE